jgi:hypothetical protein
MMIVSSVVNQSHLVYMEMPTTHPPHTRHSGADIPYEKPSNRFNANPNPHNAILALSHRGAIPLPVHTNAAKITRP